MLGCVALVALIIIYFLAREIWFAVHPDKRPLKRNRRDE